MIQAFVAKKLVDVALKKVMKAREIKNLKKYVEEDNELDYKVKELENSIALLNAHIEIQEKHIEKLEKDSHPPVFSKSNYKDLLKRIMPTAEVLDI